MISCLNCSTLLYIVIHFGQTYQFVVSLSSLHRSYTSTNSTLHSYLSLFESLTLDLSSAEIAGRIFGDLERTGQPIGRADPMIAAIALRHDLTLVTGNTAHYQRIQSLGYRLKLDYWKV